MRVAHPSVWFQKSNKSGSRRPPDTATSTDHLAVPSFYPTNKGHPRPSSPASLRSLLTSSASYAHRSTPTLNTTHPFSHMAHAPLPVVSSHDSSEDEEDCPVCLEPLSFSFRLPGEKPHIVPECGHALHEVCVFFLNCLLYRPLVSSLVALEAQSRASFRVPSSRRGCSARRLLPSFFPPPLLIYVREPVAQQKVRDSYRIR